MRCQSEENFPDFHGKWMRKLEDLHGELIRVSSEDRNNATAACEAVTNKLTAHYKEYYTRKWAAAREDALAFFTPVWLTPLENAFLWVTGWKPVTAFRVVEALRNDRTKAPAGEGHVAWMSDDQVKKMDCLRLKIKFEEEKVEREMERQQVAIAGRKIVELARMESAAGCSAAGVVSVRVDAVLSGVVCGLEKVMKMADCVRLQTLKGVMEVLDPMECVEFLASMANMEIQMRKRGEILRMKKHCTTNNQIIHDKRK